MHPLLYISTINVSIVVIISVGMLAGMPANVRSASVRAGNIAQVSHAVFFPLLANDDVVSHPVRAWNIGKAFDFRGPRDVAIS